MRIHEPWPRDSLYWAIGEKAAEAEVNVLAGTVIDADVMGEGLDSIVVHGRAQLMGEMVSWIASRRMCLAGSKARPKRWMALAVAR